MCGIVGIMGHDREDQTRLHLMLNSLAHRGPDDEGVYSGDGIHLGQRRLSIIDLGGGHQPIGNEDQSLWIVFNGEIYNYQALKKDLLQRGHIFITDSDTEVILHLYEEYREKCLDYLRGMFAFAIWDEKKKELFAARDHLGQKPFYYSQDGNKFIFSSEIKSILAYDPALNTLDLQALDQYLSLRIIGSPRSMFRSIKKLPPANFLTIDSAGQLKISRYWQINYEPKWNASDDDLVDELESHILESLRLHMVSDVPVGAFLSGGLDSTLIVAMLMEKIAPASLQTFTIGLPYQQFNEAPYAKIIADKYGTSHTEQVLTPSLIPQIVDLVKHLDEPSDPLALCSYLISGLARKNVKVVLGGDGGDELFGGYDRYYANLYSDYLTVLPTSLRRNTLGRLLDLIPDGKWYKSRTHQLKWLYQMSFLTGGSRYARSLGFFYFNPQMKAELYGPRLQAITENFDAEADIRESYENAGAIEGLDRMLSADSSIRLPDHSVMILDRMSMAHGLEVRCPFMDHVLAEFSARLPVRMKIRGRNLRYIQRKLAERYLPEEVLNRSKQGFSSALPYMLQKEYRFLFDTYLKNSRLAETGLLLQPSIDRFLAEHLQGKRDHGNRLWLLLNAEIWYRIHIDKQASEEFKADMLVNYNKST
jgi:asparagine synthase (glutamine-hydrolysing)